MMYPAIDTDITAAGFVAVRLPANHSCSAFSLWTADDTNWIKSISSDGAGPIPVTIPLSLEIPHGSDATGTILCYAKGTSSTKLVGEITKR